MVAAFCFCATALQFSFEENRTHDELKRAAKERALKSAQEAYEAAIAAAAEARWTALDVAGEARVAETAADAGPENEKAADAAYLAVCTATGIIEQEAREAADREYWAAEAAYEANRKRWFPRRPFPKMETN
jgi:hypothetical protein